MWKVRKQMEDEFVVLSLSGRIQQQELIELEKVFTSEVARQPVVLDLKEVKLVDQEAVAFLARCETGGTALRDCPPYIREWITRERPGQ
jgi:ABC-type transporter Mla MlaB component